MIGCPNPYKNTINSKPNQKIIQNRPKGLKLTQIYHLSHGPTLKAPYFAKIDHYSCIEPNRPNSNLSKGPKL